MRVTFSTSFRETMADVNRAAEELAASERQVSSGRRLNQPSDDPAAASAVISDQAALSQIDAYLGASDAATSRLTVVDTTLSDIIDKITAAKTAALGARGSAQTASQRDAAAAELQGILEALVGDFNAQFNGAYLFSGTSATTPPYTMAGGTVSAYQGNSQTMAIDTGPGRTTQASFDGRSIAQGSDGEDIFTVLANLVTAVKAGDSNGIGQGLDALGRAFDRATLAQTQVGISLNGIEATRAQLTAARLDVASRISKARDANMAEAISAMSQDETAYRAALAAFSRIGSLSLMDYLK